MIDKKKLKSAISIEDYYRSILGNPKKTNKDHWIYFCLFHDDQTTPNLAVYFDGGFNCFCCGAKGGDVLSFHKKKTGNSFSEVLNELAKKYLPSLLEENNGPSMKKRLTATYPYKNENGELLFQVLRYDSKDFPIRLSMRRNLIKSKNIGTSLLEPFCGHFSWMRNGSFFMLIYIGLIYKGNV